MSNDTSWDRTCVLPICSTAPYPLCFRGPLDCISRMIFDDESGQFSSPLCSLLHSPVICSLLLLLPSALQPTVSFGLSNNVLPFFPVCHQLSPSSHSQHLKISFCFLFPSFPGSSPSSRPIQFLSEDLLGHPIHLHSL